MAWLLIALGGALGTALRYGVGELAAAHAAEDGWFPWGTFAANALGSLLLGVVFVALDGKELLGVDARLVVGTGMMGGFTTYSTFNLEALRFFESGHVGRGAAYMGATVTVCLLGGLAGLALARRLTG